MAPAPALCAGPLFADPPRPCDELPCLSGLSAAPPSTWAVDSAGTARAAAGAPCTRPGTSAAPRARLLAAFGLGLAAWATRFCAGTGSAPRGCAPADARAADPVAGPADAGPVDRRVAPPCRAGPLGALGAGPGAAAGPANRAAAWPCLVAGSVGPAAGWPGVAGAWLDAVGGRADGAPRSADPAAGLRRGAFARPGRGSPRETAWPPGAVDGRFAAAGPCWAVGAWPGTAAPGGVWDAKPAATPGCAPGMLLPPGCAVTIRAPSGGVVPPATPAVTCAGGPWC